MSSFTWKKNIIKQPGVCHAASKQQHPTYRHLLLLHHGWNKNLQMKTIPSIKNFRTLFIPSQQLILNVEGDGCMQCGLHCVHPQLPWEDCGHTQGGQENSEESHEQITFRILWVFWNGLVNQCIPAQNVFLNWFATQMPHWVDFVLFPVSLLRYIWGPVEHSLLQQMYLQKNIDLQLRFLTGWRLSSFLFHVKFTLNLQQQKNIDLQLRCLTGWSAYSSSGCPGCSGWTGLDDPWLQSPSCSGNKVIFWIRQWVKLESPSCSGFSAYFWEVFYSVGIYCQAEAVAAWAGRQTGSSGTCDAW